MARHGEKAEALERWCRHNNTELRKEPTLRGNMVIRLSIEANGAVSMCKVESTDLASPGLIARIVDSIKRFDFGAKEGVQKVTILYLIDFFPSGEKDGMVGTGFEG